MTALDSDPDMRRRIREALADSFSPAVAERSELEKMGGHASLRIYWRVHLPTGDGAPVRSSEAVGGGRLVAMVLAPDYEPHRSAEGPADEQLETEELPFVDVQRYLAGVGVPVPSVERVDRDVDVLLVEDLGDRSFGDAIREIRSDDDLEPAAERSELEALYRQALELLVEMQAALVDSREVLGESVRDECICWRRRFERRTLRWELDHYLEWGLEARSTVDGLDSRARDRFDEAFDALVEELAEVDQLPVHRDFQSSNLMERGRESRERPWVVIDFQDALLGPVVYDVVSLLRDSYVELPPDLVSELLETYLRLGRDAGLEWCRTPERIRRLFHLQTVQRKLKDAGRFVCIDRTNDNPEFLAYYEPSIRYVDAALQHLRGGDELRDLLHRFEPSLR